jgi:hypothetical protein
MALTQVCVQLSTMRPNTPMPAVAAAVVVVVAVYDINDNNNKVK